MTKINEENRNQSEPSSARTMAQQSVIDSKKQKAFERFTSTQPQTDAMMKAIDLLADKTCNDTDFENALTGFGYGKATKEAVKSQDPEVIMNQVKQKLFEKFQSSKPSTSAILKAMDLLADDTCNETVFEETLMILK